jgi:phenylacetic acid degradation operon negative regulatory protein
VCIFSARLEDLPDAASPLTTAANAWDLAELNTAYRQFIARFEPYLSAGPHAPNEAFALRILLIHEYRRILLKDPALPGDLLPDGWSGATARDLAAHLYRQIAGAAETYISATLQNWQGGIGKAQPAATHRFA